VLRLPKLSLAQSGVRLPEQARRDLQTDQGPYRGHTELALCLLLARNGPPARSDLSPLLGAKQKLAPATSTSEFDRTYDQDYESRGQEFEARRARQELILCMSERCLREMLF
jgi:hypothetical protein